MDETNVRSTGRRREVSMNHSFYSADRMTHLKIVVVALVAAIGVAGIGISARLSVDDGLTQTARVSGPVVKASKSVVMTSSDQAVIR
jgi:hypothetical protein